MPQAARGPAAESHEKPGAGGEQFSWNEWVVEHRKIVRYLPEGILLLLVGLTGLGTPYSTEAVPLVLAMSFGSLTRPVVLGLALLLWLLDAAAFVTLGILTTFGIERTARRYHGVLYALTLIPFVRGVAMFFIAQHAARAIGYKPVHGTWRFRAALALWMMLGIASFDTIQHAPFGAVVVNELIALLAWIAVAFHLRTMFKQAVALIDVVEPTLEIESSPLLAGTTPRGPDLIAIERSPLLQGPPSPAEETRSTASTCPLCNAAAGSRVFVAYAGSRFCGQCNHVTLEPSAFQRLRDDTGTSFADIIEAYEASATRGTPCFGCQGNLRPVRVGGELARACIQCGVATIGLSQLQRLIA